MALERLLPNLHDTTVVAIVGGEEAPEVRARMLFSVDEKVLCFHVGLLYEAKILKAEKWTGEENLNKDVGPHYFVHYMGWRSRWDEWVPETRMMKLNEDNIGKQKALLESVKAAQEAKLQESGSVKGGRKSGGAGGASTSAAGSVRESSEVAESGADRRKTKEARGTKRGRDAVEQEEEYIKRPEIKLNIPDALKVRLVDDWEFVTKRNQLVPLPRKPCVDEILASYRAHYLSVKRDQKASRPSSVLDEVLDGLRLYFDKALGNNLLYRFERPQYVQQRKVWAEEQSKEAEEEAEMQPIKVYGAEHLLRLFVNLPSIIAHTTMDAEAILLLKEHLAELFAYILKEQKKLFVDEYETPSPSYNRLAST